MVGRKRKAPPRAAAKAGLPDIYQDMLAEAGASGEAEPASDPPAKRRKPGEKPGNQITIEKRHASASEASGNEDDDDDDIEFEDVLIPAPNLQTTTRESDDEDETDEEDIEFEDVDLGPVPTPSSTTTSSTAPAPAAIELNLTAHKSSGAAQQAERRKPLSKAERDRRMEVHKAHVLCLLIHCARRNRWCNDPDVQNTLRPLLTPKMLSALRPKANLNQFGMTESLKDGLTQASRTFKTKFQVTERGLRRCLWAEKADTLDKVPPAL